MNPERYRPLPIDATPFNGFTLADFRGNERKRPEYGTGVFWLEFLRQLDANRAEAKVWIILNTPEDSTGNIRYDGRKFFVGQLTVTEQDGKLSASSLDTLTKGGGYFLVPPQAKRVGDSPLLRPTSIAEDGWVWLKSDEVLATKDATEKGVGWEHERVYGIGIHHLKLAKDRFIPVRSTTIGVEGYSFVNRQRLTYSPDGQYFAFLKPIRDTVFQHVYRTDSNRRLYLIQDVLRPGLFEMAWISNTEWVNYKNRDRRLILDRFSVHTGKKVESRSYGGLLQDEGDWLGPTGVTAKGELALWRRDGEEVKPLELVLVPWKGGKPTVLKIPQPANDYPRYVKLSPDGRLLLWFMAQDSDPWFFRNSIWVTRADGSGKRHLADMIQSRTGWSEDFPAQPRWRRDSRSIGAVWENCLYSFDIG